eukprot:scaffold127184_cov84-Phaeocystis_antarctica.AAC.6
MPPVDRSRPAAATARGTALHLGMGRVDRDRVGRVQVVEKARCGGGGGGDDGGDRAPLAQRPAGHTVAPLLRGLGRVRVGAR